MAEAVKTAEEDQIDYLVRKRFPVGHLATRSPALNSGTAGFLAQQRCDAENYRQELGGYDPERIQQLVLAEREEENRPKDPLTREAAADFTHWAKLAYWTPEEAVALSFGKAPDFGMSFQRVNAMRAISRIAKDYVARWEIVERARTMGQLWDRSAPGAFVAWAARMSFPMPQELVQAVKDLGIQIADWKTLYDQQTQLLAEKNEEVVRLRNEQIQATRENREFIAKWGAGWNDIAKQQSETIDALRGRIERLVGRLAELENPEATLAAAPKSEPTTRERQSLLKLALGPAMKKYGYNPKLAKNPAIANIATHLRQLGIPLDEDTIRKYLNEAKELLGDSDPA